MKEKIFAAAVLPAVLILTQQAPAQSTLYVSNLGQTPAGSAPIGSDAWIAQSFFTFVTDPNSYFLDSVQLLMNPAAGNPDGFSVSIYDSLAGGAPQNNLGNLVGSEPTAGGIFTFTASGITILQGRSYYVVATAQTPLAQGSYNWSAVFQTTTQNGNWNINDIYYSSADGSAWAKHLREDVFQMAIYATAVPEPATCSVVAMGLMLLGLRCYRQAK